MCVCQYCALSKKCKKCGVDVWLFFGSAAAMWPVGLMDKASASGAGDSRLESWVGHFCRSYSFERRNDISGDSAVGSA